MAHPAHEVANINGIACTATACETGAQSISSAQSESNQSNADAGTAQANLEAALARARRRMTGLRQELTQRIAEDDDRWYAFGFDKPGDPITPEVPENLTVIAGAPGSRTLFLHCDDARRADSYRFRVTNVAGGAQVGEKLSDEPEAMIGGLPQTNVNVTVSARNSTGESQPSAPVAATVP